MIRIILPLFIQVCLPRIFKKPCRRWLLKTFPSLSRLTVSSWGNERGLMAAPRLSDIPLTWPYRRNALQPRVRWGQCRKRPVCGAVSTTYRRRVTGRHPWHHLRNHCSLKLIADTRVRPLPLSACHAYGVIPKVSFWWSGKNKCLVDFDLYPDLQDHMWLACAEVQKSGSGATERLERRGFLVQLAANITSQTSHWVFLCLQACCLDTCPIVRPGETLGACAAVWTVWVCGSEYYSGFSRINTWENRLELFSRFPRISLVPWSVRQSAHCAPSKQFRGKVGGGPEVLDVGDSKGGNQTFGETFLLQCQYLT